MVVWVNQFYIMKKTILVVLILLSFNVSFGQLPIDSLFQNKEEKLLLEKVVTFDSLSVTDLYIKIREWSGKEFKNEDKVLVSNTPTQLIFRYVSTSFYIKGLLGEPLIQNRFIKMVINIKTNKIKISIFDDGDGVYNTPLSSNVLFKNNTARKMYNDGLINLKKSVINISNDLVRNINKKDKVW